ncbi:hypothetical protein SAMD00019534_073960 [Acytostelium subglobosum LB1]|uniref:hypothetical protein n=1 Tax=Acytostelium subglobosum LB1 TaxID=1410327 RepID=UPI00064522E5|nr:hypothetical protein SAMD00019534_073960 [Acytostelium subglobosum LB1]GAM24221.1 hypothetical protein SAMD00019534_073960 [Acytostelium subglobosum LB1]|eukprot:XP_012752547.1 hypothetical protein SAMD00019534_073960 [Acytostelium subglobosum LB1]
MTSRIYYTLAIFVLLATITWYPVLSLEPSYAYTFTNKYNVENSTIYSLFQTVQLSNGTVGNQTLLHPLEKTLAAFVDQTNTDYLVYFGYTGEEFVLQQLDTQSGETNQLGTILPGNHPNEFYLFGYDPKAQIITNLYLDINYELYLIQWDFANNICTNTSLNITNPNALSGAYDPASGEYYVSYYLKNDVQKLMSYNIFTKTLSSPMNTALEMFEMFMVNGNLYGTQVIQQPNTFELSLILQSLLPTPTIVATFNSYVVMPTTFMADSSNVLFLTTDSLSATNMTLIILDVATQETTNYTTPFFMDSVSFAVLQ